MKSTKVMMGVLMVSVITNVYLLATRSAGTPGPAATSGSSAPRGERRGDIAALSRTTRVPDASASDPAGGAALDPAAREREAALTAQLLKSQAELEEHLPLDKRFQRAAERSPEIEEQARSALDKVFVTKPGQKPIYTVECHGAVCSLDVDDDQDPAVWMKTLQESSAREAFPGMSFSATATYLEVASPEYLAGSRYAQSVFELIRSSPATAACKQRFPTPGEVVLELVLGPARQVRVAMTGRLADKDFGACLRPVADQAPSQLPPPPTNVQRLPGVLIVSVTRPDAPTAPDAPVERRPMRQHLASKLSPLAN